jgi:hypothetical protein
MARHDPHRTARATGESDIVQPVAYWKRYIGGTLGAEALLVEDVDGDGASEILMLIGGSAVAKGRADVQLWHSQNLELVSFIGLVDLDGAVGKELVARSNDRIYVFDPRDGSVRWSQPAGEIGTIGATRLGDISGDGLPDLVVQDCGCCQVLGPNNGFAYSFATVTAPTQLWELPIGRCGARSLTLVDPDGDGVLDVIVGDTHELVLLDGRTGIEMARTVPLGDRVNEAKCVPVDLDGAPGEELVCARDARLNPTERGVFALQYQGGTTLALLWSSPVAAIDGGAIRWVELVDDLDGNGTFEVVVSGSLDGTNWDTYVKNAMTGLTRATIPGEVIMGVAPKPSGAVLLTASDTELTGWNYFAPSTVTRAWAVPDAVVPQTSDLVIGARTDISTRATLALVDADAVPDLIATLRSEPGTLLGLDVSGPVAIERARFALPAKTKVLQAYPLATADVDFLLAVADNDGSLTLFDRFLLPARIPGDDVGQVRIRTGGYYAPGFQRVDNTPRSARLDDGTERVLLVDSRGSMIVLDAELASFAAPPRLLWEVYGAFSPTVVDDLDDGEPGIACLALDDPPTTPATYSVMALSGSGDVLWRQPAPPKPVNDVVPGNFDDVAGPDLVFQWGDPGDILQRTRAIAGTDGATLWDAVPVDPGGGRKPKGVAIAPFDADGFDDVYHQANRTQVLSGATGGELATSGPGTTYVLPTLANLDADAALEIVLHGGPDPVRVLDHDLASTLQVSPDNNRPFPFGAVATCGGRDVFVEGSELNPARLKLTDVSGPASGDERTVVLAGGAAYANEAAASAVTGFLGTLTSATVHPDLTALGRPSAVVGSTDGWLYAIDPCTGALDFSYAFGASVGESIFGDTDGDGRDEILVTVEDGYLYSLRDFEIDAPGNVRDTDPFSDAPEDLFELQTESRLEATWAAVEDAARYEVAVVDANGNYVGTPWRDAGTGTSMLITGLPLVDGGFYRVAVRTLRSDGRYSVDTVSNGIWVIIGGSSADGCCRATAPGSPGIVLVLITGALLLRRRRPR